MAFKKIITLFIAALATCTIQAQQVKLIPEPSSIQIGNGTFKLPNQITIQVPTVFESIATAMSERFKAVTGKSLIQSNQKNATIRFEQVQDNALGKEGYQLMINEKTYHTFSISNYINYKCSSPTRLQLSSYGS